jgi:hypothetical protein
MRNPQLWLHLLQSALSLYAVVYLVSALGLPLFYLRSLSIGELSERKASKWRLWAQGLITALSVGVLVWSAAYAIVAGIPYDWGSHDEDGDWQATRETIRFMITFVGVIYFTFGMDKIAQSLALQKFARALIRGDSPEPEIETAMRRLHRDLTLDHYRGSHWRTNEDRDFSAALLRALDETIRSYGGKRADDF